MSTIYPKITWVNQGEIDGNDKRWKGTALGYEIDLRYQWSGEWKGHWTAILNHGAIQTGTGPHGYLFANEDEAGRAVKAEMHRRIDERIQTALAVLNQYTNILSNVLIEGDVVRCVAYTGPAGYYTVGALYTVETHRGVVTVRNDKGCRSFEDKATFQKEGKNHD